MKQMVVTMMALLLGACASHRAFVLHDQNSEWAFYRLRSSAVTEPFAVSVATPTPRFHVFDVVSVNTNTTKCFVVELVDGRSVELFILNGGEAYELNVLKDGEGMTHSFESDGTLLGSGIRGRMED
jgi:hypothetical protein